MLPSGKESYLLLLLPPPPPFVLILTGFTLVKILLLLFTVEFRVTFHPLCPFPQRRSRGLLRVSQRPSGGV